MAESEVSRHHLQSARGVTANGNSNSKPIQCTLERQLVELENFTIDALRAAWVDRFGGRPPPIQSADVLRRLFAWKVQAKALGGLDHETALRLVRLKTRLVKGKECKPPPSLGLGAGTILTREWKGREHRILVLDDGFEHQGKRYGSLSKVARAITGTQWSGPRFFGLEAGQAIDQRISGEMSK